MTNCRFQEGDATDLSELADRSFDLVVSIFGAMFAPKPFDVASEMVRVTRPGGRDRDGQLDPKRSDARRADLKISSSYSPPPPEGFISPMTWGIESNVIERFGAAGVQPDRISFARDTYTFRYPGPPAAFVAEFRNYYGPTMNAFAAAEQNGKAAELQRELEALFERQNQSADKGSTLIRGDFSAGDRRAVVRFHVAVVAGEPANPLPRRSRTIRLLRFGCRALHFSLLLTRDQA